MMFPGMEWIPVIVFTVCLAMVAGIAAGVHFFLHGNPHRKALTLAITVGIVAAIYFWMTRCVSPIPLPNDAAEVRIYRGGFEIFFEDRMRCRTSKSSAISVAELLSRKSWKELEESKDPRYLYYITNGFFENGSKNDNHLYNTPHWLDTENIRNGFEIRGGVGDLNGTLWYDSDRKYMYYEFSD